MSQYKAILFDLDGVIVETAHFYYLAWKRLANEKLNSDFTHEFNEILKGISRMMGMKVVMGKTLIIKAILFVGFLFLFSCTKEVVDDEIYNIVDSSPEYIEGGVAKIAYFQENTRHSTEAIKLKIEGRIFTTFIVEKDGDLSHIQILKGIGYGYDEEAIRLLDEMPLWKPGKSLGKIVRVQYNQPINFSSLNAKK